MMSSGVGTRAALYALFTLSGLAGLVYESIWTHYLKLFLGHAAYAQTLVLAIFMGGLAFGAWLVSTAAGRLARPLLAYAGVEAVLGLLGLAFDPLFRGMQQWAYDTAIPALDSPLAITAFKWTAGALMILPQSVLLGMTFPLMSAGVVRLFPVMPGRVLAWLYFTNSLGAAIGVLVSGFVLISRVGLPGTVLTAGLINLLLVLLIWPIARRPSTAPVPAAPAQASSASGASLLLAVSFFTGAASFFYEIGWIRMLSLVLGSATHSFELMIAAFIFGLALGSFLIRTRLEGLANPLRTLAWIQVLMATFALLTIPLYAGTFDAMAWALEALQRNDAGYALFSVFSQGLCLFLMLPVTICAGMTLPLITQVLLRRVGERAIGRVYAINTLGAITGVVVAVHGVMPLLGLRQVIVAGALIDLAIGAALFAAVAAATTARGWLVRGATVAVALGLAVFTRFDSGRLASGVFRTGEVGVQGDIVFHRDGKTASIDVWEAADGTLTIATNGKTDASLHPLKPSVDDTTQVLLGALPLLLHPRAAEIAVIGLGSGRTTHTLLVDPRVQAVDTVEIEPAMIAGARHFGPLVHRAFDDPRSRLHVEDAKTFFATRQQRFDVIVSEPSNPWVSGVASLFSDEFYREARRYLRPGGHFVQWLQLYEIDAALVATVFNALTRNFADFHVYAADDYNIVIVASAADAIAPVSPKAFAAMPAALRELLSSIGVRGVPDVALRRLGGRASLAPFFAATGVPANSDYFPVLEQGAVRSRFLQRAVDEFVELQPFAARLEGLAPLAGTFTEVETFNVGRRAGTAGSLARAIAAQGPVAVELDAPALRLVATLRGARAPCSVPVDEAWLESVQTVGWRFLPYMTAADAKAVVAQLRASSCFGRTSEIRAWLDLLEASAQRDPERIRQLAPELLARVPDPAVLPRWPASELLLADLEAGAPQAVLERLREWGDRAPDAIEVQYLRANALARMSR